MDSLEKKKIQKSFPLFSRKPKFSSIPIQDFIFSGSFLEGFNEADTFLMIRVVLDKRLFYILQYFSEGTVL